MIIGGANIEIVEVTPESSKEIQEDIKREFEMEAMEEEIDRIRERNAYWDDHGFASEAHYLAWKNG